MLDKEREAEIFEELNSRLRDNDIDLTIICVGGFVLSQYGMRSTQDIDGFYSTTHLIDEIIRSVGEDYGINTEDEVWLNNSVQGVNKWPPDEICKVLYSYSNLTILTPPLDYIAGMKIFSAREQDVEDVAEIFRKLDIRDPVAFLNRMEDYGLGYIDESILLETFGIAYGMDWLEEYFIKHEDEIAARIRDADT